MLGKSNLTDTCIYIIRTYACNVYNKRSKKTIRPFYALCLMRIMLFGCRSDHRPRAGEISFGKSDAVVEGIGTETVRSRPLIEKRSDFGGGKKTTRTRPPTKYEK